MSTVHVAYDDRLLRWRLGTGHPSNPKRALLAVHALRKMGVPLAVHRLRPGTMAEMLSVHSATYVGRLLRQGRSDEWAGQRFDLACTARLMFGGTMGLVDRLLEDGEGLAFAPQGAKHHAMRDRSSGFCVLNDFAAAALRFRDAGARVLYVDWDAHHGDGVEAILRHEAGIVTASIHDSTIFPGTGRRSEPENGVLNWPLAAGSGDEALHRAMLQVGEFAEAYRPDVLLVAAGADGHLRDPLATLTYSYRGLEIAAELAATIEVRTTLIGGAGGYMPYDVVPTVWSQAVAAFHRASVTRGRLVSAS